MKKVYIDLAIVIVSVFLIFKFTKLFIAIAVIGAIVWFFVIDKSMKKKIKDNISNLYRM